MDTAESVLACSPVSLHQALECCKGKRASSWLSAIPVEQHGFALHKTDLTDALFYVMAGLHHTYHLTVFAAKPFQFLMLFSCPHGAFPILRHNDVRDRTAKLMSEVCHDIQVEPYL